MEYNCKHCREYWEKEPDDSTEDLVIAIFNAPDDLLEYIKLYCPRCKRTKREW